MQYLQFPKLFPSIVTANHNIFKSTPLKNVKKKVVHYADKKKINKNMQNECAKCTI